MRCLRCLAVNDSSAVFCSQCGDPLDRTCSACGSVAPSDREVCPHCGMPLAPEEPHRPLPDGPQLRHATVLFSDLSGYTELNESLEPEDVADVMNGIKDAARRVVEAHGGVVNQFVGDQVMALFGASVTFDDDPSRAVRAAIELHAFVRRMSRRLEPQRRLALHTGINTGRILLQRRDERDGLYAVTGDVINTGARLATVAGPDEIIVGADAHMAIATVFDTESIGHLSLKGKGLPVLAYRVRGLAAWNYFEAAKRRGLGACIGRSRELAQLEACLRSVAEGEGGLVTVAGAPGVGKSRLFHEFMATVRREDFLLHYSRCEPVRSVAPYAPFVQVVRQVLELPDGRSREELEQAATVRLAQLGLDRPRLIPVYFHLIALRSETHPLPLRLLGEDLREAILEALLELITALSQERPLILIVEDWHWSDPASELALRRLTEHLAGLRVLVLLNYRSHLKPEWSLAPRAHIDLPPLSLDDASHLVEQLFHPASVPESWRLEICDRTGGNPFFIEEVCRSFAEEASSGDLRPGAPFPRGLVVPATVELAVRARIDRLADEPVHVLQLASVLGPEFPLTLLHCLAPRPDALQDHLDVLRDAELLQPVGRDDVGTWRFRHAIIRDVAYRTLLRRHRLRLHEEAGAVIESLYEGDRREAHFEALAHHFSESANREKAIFYRECAGNRAVASFALEQARDHFGAAVKELAGSTTSRQSKQRLIDLTFKWAQAGWYGPTLDQIDALGVASELATELGDRGRALRSIYFTGWLRHTMGDSRVAIETFRRCLAMADPGDARFLSQLCCSLGENLANNAEYDSALESLEKGIELRRRELPGQSRTIGMAYAYSYVGLIHADRGNVRAAVASLDQGLSIVDELGHGSALSSVNQVRCFIFGFAGEWKRCLEYALLGQQVARNIGSPPNYAMARTVEGWCRGSGMRDHDGIPILEEGLDLMRQAGSGLGLSVYWSQLAELLARNGETGRAEAYARRAISRGADGDRIGETAAHRALGLALAAERPEEARAAFDRATQLAWAKGSPREVALTNLVRAECGGPLGETAAAPERACAAHHALSQLGITGYDAQYEALLDRLRCSS